MILSSNKLYQRRSRYVVKSFLSSVRNNCYKPIKVVFCGKGDFMGGYLYTAEYLKKYDFIKVIQCENESLVHDLEDADVIVPYMGRITEHVISSASRLKLIMQFGAGLEGVDIKAANKYDVRVARIPSSICENATSCAEHIIYLTLSLMRKQSAMAQSLRDGIVGVPTGRTIKGSKLLIYGFGGIGQQLYHKMVALGAEVRVIANRMPEEGSIPGLPRSAVGTHGECFSAFAAGADLIALCCSQNSANIGMVDEAFLRQCKEGVMLVNVARGGLLNYQDVWNGLESGHVGGLGIDVFHTEPFPVDDQFLSHSRVVATPHIAGVTERSYRGMAKILSENILRVSRGETPLHVIN